MQIGRTVGTRTKRKQDSRPFWWEFVSKSPSDNAGGVLGDWDWDQGVAMTKESRSRAHLSNVSSSASLPNNLNAQCWYIIACLSSLEVVVVAGSALSKTYWSVSRQSNKKPIKVGGVKSLRKCA